jgi:hypothetical protein
VKAGLLGACECYVAAKIVPVFDAAVNVRVAWIEAPAARTVFYRFQVNVSEEPAPVEVQLFVVIVNVSAILPVFLTWMFELLCSYNN